MDRRHFMAITGTALTSFAHDWLLEPERIAAAVQGKRIDHTVVDDLEHVAEARRRLDDSLGGGAAVFRAVREDLRLILEILDNASYTEEVGKRLYAVAAEFARQAGWLAYDLNQNAQAQRYFIAGLRAAHSSCDRAIGAQILAQMSEQARHGDPRDAVRLAESGLAGATSLTPAVAAHLYANLAKAAASAGDKTKVDWARGRAFELTATIDHAAEPPWIYWWTEATAHHRIGQAALALDDPRQAEAHFRDALTRVDPSIVRARGLWLGLLANARVRMGELEGACRAASEAGAIAHKLGSERVRARLVAFRRAIEPHANTPAVKDFDAKFGDLLRA
jgi:hypothetical protein